MMISLFFRNVFVLLCMLSSGCAALKTTIHTTGFDYYVSPSRYVGYSCKELAGASKEAATFIKFPDRKVNFRYLDLSKPPLNGQLKLMKIKAHKEVVDNILGEKCR